MSEVRYFYGNSYVSDLWAPRDIVAEGAYLRPSVSNAAVICQWMTKIAGTYSQQNFWSNGFSSNSLTYNTESTGGGYTGSILQNNGTVWIWPGNTTNGVVYNPKTGTSTTYTPSFAGSNRQNNACMLPDGRILAIPKLKTESSLTLWNSVTNTEQLIDMSSYGIKGQLAGACQLPDGRICLAPGNAVNGIANVITYDQNTGVFTNVYALSGTGGCILDVTGNVVFVPTTETVGISVWNPTTNVRSTISISGMTDGFTGATVVPDGRIVFGPWTQNHIGVYNPLTYTYTSYPITVPAGVNYACPKTLPNGYVLLVPFSLTYFGLFNPYTNTYSTFSATNVGAFTGATVVPDGRIVLANNTGFTGVPIMTGMNAPVSMEWCLHPFFNRYP